MPRAGKGWPLKLNVSVPDQRFSRYNRLTNPSDFRKVFASSKRVAGSDFIILSRQNGLDTARLGIVISRKSVRFASTRNKLKRLIREKFRRHKAELKGLDLVVIAKKSIKTGNHSIIVKSLSESLEKIKRA